MKRKYITFASLALLLSFASCTDEELAGLDSASSDSVAGGHTVVINAGNSDMTRTAISETQTGFKVSWQEDDKIDLFEVIPSIGTTGNIVKCYTSAGLTASNITDGAAKFSVTIDNDRSGKDSYSYLAVYPGTNEENGSSSPNHVFYTPWTSESDEAYTYWKHDWNYNGDYVEPHATLITIMPNNQSPTATSFDPSADVMISEMKETTSQLTEAASMRFARVGSIICITCKGLDAYKGKKVTQAVFGGSYAGNGDIYYDTFFKKMILRGDGPFKLSPKEDVIVKEDGTVDLWIRGFSGSITDWCCLKLVLGGSSTAGNAEIESIEDDITLMRRVNIASPQKNITMEESKLTKFGVGSFLLADIPQPSVDLFYLTNDAGNGFTAMWNNTNEDIRGYKYEIKKNNSDETAIKTGNAVADGNGLWKITIDDGLSTGKYNVNLIPVIPEGHCYNLDDYTQYGTTEYIVKSSITLNLEGETGVGLNNIQYSYTQDGTQFTPGSAQEDTEYIYNNPNNATTIIGPRKVGFYNVTRGDGYITPLNGKADWKIYTMIPFKQIKKVRVYYKNDKTDFKVCLGNSVKGTDYTATTHTSGSDLSGSYYEYDFTGLEKYYKYLTICDDDGQSTSANIFYVKIDYVQ